MQIEIPNRIIEKSGISEEEILLRVAIMLFQEEKLTLGQASELAGLDQIDFQKELAQRDIPIHYGEKEYRKDLKNIRRIP